ncbi:MAG: Hsp20/alpha crystallin family protein [Ferrovum sp.]|nr:Hsp20/alpha crystallin family protein [Ferrovum sp.]
MNEQNTVAARNDNVLTPLVDVIEDAAGITLYADLPGVPKDKVSLQVEANTLTIEGDIALDASEGQPRFRRVFTLSKELDGEKVTADFDQGVLKLRIPKAAHAQPRKIDIQVH